MQRKKTSDRREADSYVEIRMMLLIGFAILALAITIPAILRAADLNDDNLDDAWEAQYGFSTNAYAITNLVGWWQMQSNSTNAMVDSSTNRINGTLTNFPNSPFGTGLFSNALYFPANGQVNFPTNNGLNTTTNQFTFSAWFQSTNSLSQPATIATWTDAETNSWSVGADTNGIAGIRFSDSLGNIQTIGPATGAIQLYDGTWHQVAVTYSTNQFATVYVDGQNQASGAITNWASGPVASFSLGIPNTGSTNQPYALDDTRLYNRALGSNEVTQLPVTYTDLNGSGLTVYEDYLEGLNPLSTNSIVTLSFINSGLTGYYGSNLPTLTKASGDGQIIPANAFATNPLVVHVTNGSGTALTNAPITFTIASGSDGGVALTSGGTTTTSLSLTTDSSGNATVYYQAGGENLQNNIINATAVSGVGSAVVSFTEHCGVQSGLALWLKADAGATYDGSNNVGGWVDQTGNYTVTQGTTGNKPSYVTGDINGKPALRFNGTQYLANTSNVGLNADMTIITVAATSSPSSIGYSLTLGNDATGTDRGMGYYQSAQILNFWNADATGSAAPSANTFVIEEATLDSTRTNVVFYRNGQQTAASTVSGLQNVGAGVWVGIRATSGGGWQGDISEVLVYDHKLSSTDLAHVDGYLADKYGLYSLNATWPLAYSSNVQAEITRNQWNKPQTDAYVAFQSANPTMLTNGLAAWFKADSLPTNTTSVSTWADQTGSNTVAQNTNANQPTYVPSDINGKPAVRFNGNQWLSNPRNIGPGLNADMTIITVAATTSPSSLEYSLTLGNDVTGADRGMGFYQSAQILNFWNAAATGSAAARANMFVVDEATLNSTGTNVVFYRNGQQTAATAVSGLQNVGAGVWLGTRATSGAGWLGDISEVLVYDHQLSSTELQQVGVYLADKYGLYNPNATWPNAYSTEVQGEITRNKWNKSQADAYVLMENNNPTMLTHGLVQWLKADDTNAVATDNNDANGSNVNSWADETGNFAVSQSGTARPTYQTNVINGKPALQFNGSQSLYNPTNIGLNADMTMIFVGNTPSPSTGQIALIFGGSLTHNAYRGLGYGNSSQSFTAFSNDYSGGSVPNANTFSVQIATLDPTLTSLNFYLNGVLNNGNTTSSITMSGLQNVQAGISIGAVQGWGYNWNGDIAEVLIYDHQLSSTELQQVGVYLADKYGLYNSSATWYNNAPYLAIKSEIIQHQWSESQANQYLSLQYNTSGVVTSGLMLWATADNVSYANGTMTVTDQAGTYPLSQSTLANQPSVISNDINGHAGLHFTGSQWLSNPSNSFGAGMGADISIVTVGSNSSSGPGTFYSLYLGQNATAGQNRALGCSIYNDYFDANGLACSGSGTPSSFIAEIATLDPLANVAFYQNGNPSGTGTLSGLLGISSGITLGAAGNTVNGWQGDISEVLVYDHKLSTAEFQQLSVYLAAKYNLPFSGVSAPTISPSAGSYTNSVSVSLTGAVGPSVIKYTLDGTEPINASPTYNGPITLTGSALVQAAVFLNNQLSSPVASSQFYVNDPNQMGAPTIPTNLAVTSPSSTEDDVSWQLAGTVNYSAIDVFRSSDGGITWFLVASLDPSATSYVDTNVQSDTGYEYYVGTVNSSGQSNTSSSSLVTPAAPTTLSITVTAPSNAAPLP